MYILFEINYTQNSNDANYHYIYEILNCVNCVGVTGRALNGILIMHLKISYLAASRCLNIFYHFRNSFPTLLVMHASFG